MEFVKPRQPRLAAGAELDAFCSRCNLELAHVIVAMEGPRIARVQCNTCRTVHAYRGGPPSAKAPKQGRRDGGGRSPPSAAEYERLLAGRDLSRARPYKPALRYAQNEVVDHPIFGLGLITKVLTDGKVEVAFRGGGRVLVHDRAPSPRQP